MKYTYALMFLCLAFKKDDGKWHLPKTVSPSTPNRAVTEHHTPLTIQIMIYLCFIGAVKRFWQLQRINILMKNCVTAGRMSSIICPPFPCDERGLKVAADVSFLTDHRHFSHLFPIYPLHLWNPVNDKYRDIIIKSINNFSYNQDGTERTGDR